MNDVDKNAQILWDYMSMKKDALFKPCATALVFGSSDAHVAIYAAELFRRGVVLNKMCQKQLQRRLSY